MANKQPWEYAYDYADSQTYALLAAQQGLQVMSRDQATAELDSAIASETKPWERAYAGIYDYLNRAESKTSTVLVEVDEEVNEDVSNAERATSFALTGIKELISRLTDETTINNENILYKIGGVLSVFSDEIRKDNESILDKIGSRLFGSFDDLTSTLFGWIPELTSDTVTYLFSLPARLLFESFKNFFFEED